MMASRTSKLELRRGIVGYLGEVMGFYRAVQRAPTLELASDVLAQLLDQAISDAAKLNEYASRYAGMLPEHVTSSSEYQTLTTNTAFLRTWLEQQLQGFEAANDDIAYGERVAHFCGAIAGQLVLCRAIGTGERLVAEAADLTDTDDDQASETEESTDQEDYSSDADEETNETAQT